MIWIDMEMPDNCYCCILCRHADMFCRRLGKMLDRDDCYDERPENCPLHEVTADTDTVSRQAAIELVKDVCDAIMSGCESRYDPETEDEVYTDIREVDAILKCNKEVRIALRNMPSAQTEPLSDAYMKAVWTWLLNYQIKAAELQGRYTPYEVLSWVANDWRYDERQQRQ